MRDNFSLAYSHKTTVKGLDFLGVNYAEQLDLKSDGLLGLGPSKFLWSYSDDKRVIVDQMKQNGMIDRAIFSV